MLHQRSLIILVLSICYLCAALAASAQQPGAQPQSVLPAPSANSAPQPQPTQAAPLTATTAPPSQPQSAPQPLQNLPQSVPPMVPLQLQGNGLPLLPSQLMPAPGRESVPTVAPPVLLPVTEVAPNYRADAVPLPDLTRVGVDMSATRSISLHEAIEMALANNKDIELTRSDARIAGFNLTAAQGVYQPRFSSLSYYERVLTPVSSFLSTGSNGAVKQSDFTGMFHLEGLTPKFGGGYRIDFSSERLSTNNLFVALNPQYLSALSFNYTQPLLCGLRFDSNRRQIEIAKKTLSLTDAQFRQRVIETIINVERAYWDLVYALRNLQIQTDAVNDARAQLEHNRRLVAEGILAPIDIVAAGAQLTGFEQSVYTALEDVGRTENSLKNLIVEGVNSPLWQFSLLPTDTLNAQQPQLSLPEALARALANRQEIAQADLAGEINAIDQRYYRDQTKPQIDLVVTYGVTGLAGRLTDPSANPLISNNAVLATRVNQISTLLNLPPLPPFSLPSLPDFLSGNYGQSLANLFAGRFNNIRVGLQINFPLRNQTEEALLGRAITQGERLKTQKEQLEQQIFVEVRNALQSIHTSESRLRAAAAARSAAEQQYASERRKFDVGESTLYFVLERQSALTNARGNELHAQTDLNKAIAELQRAMGNAIEANNVILKMGK